MNPQLLCLETPDKQKLHSLWHSGGRKNIVLHFHGFNDNFYQVPFITRLPKPLSSAGFDFLTLNTRGHDQHSQQEIFTECAIDIQTACDWALGQGYKKIILQGHSTGAAKVAYFASQHRLPQMAGLALLGGVSDAEIIARDFPAEGQKLAREATAHLVQNRPHAYLSKPVYTLPITAQRFASFATLGSAEDWFSLTHGLIISKYSLLTQPIFAAYGQNDQYAVHGPTQYTKRLKKLLPNASAVIIKNADHEFSPSYNKLATALATWLKSLHV